MKNVVHFISLLVLIPGTLLAQKTRPSIKFEEGQVIPVVLRLKTSIAQEAMGQAIEFKADGEASHQFTVTRKTNDSIFLHHDVKRINFHFEGMGQKRAFDSDIDKDTSGEFGRPVRELLEKTYDIVIDSVGNVLSVVMGKTGEVKLSTQMSILANMLKDVFDVALPPAKDQGSFFKILPSRELAQGEVWADSQEQQSGKSNTTYILSAITDSTIVIEFTGTSTSITKAEMMGNETITKLNNKSTGKIILDAATGLISEKTASIESNGSTEALGGTVPVTSKTTITTIVKIK